jgi:hypothetical protein
MNAYMGGFAAAMIDDPVCVVNIVPVEAEINTICVVYERGLIGTYHCLHFVTLQSMSVFNQKL